MSGKEEAKSKSIFDKAIDKSVDFVFSNDNRKWVLLIFILGFVLRAIISLKAEVGADEMVYGPLSFGFFDSGKLQTVHGAPIWHLIIDITTKVFGTSLFGLRFFSVLLGSLTIILVYLLGKEIFDSKVGLIAASIFAFSPFQLSQMVALMDIPMSFFSFLSIYLLILFFKTDKTKYFILSWTALSIAIMIKQIAIIFIPALVLFSLYYNKKHYGRYRLKQMFYAALIIALFLMPVLTYNYLLYKDKQIVDVQISRFTGIAAEQYVDIASTMNPFNFYRAFISHDGGPPGIIKGLQFFYIEEVLLVLVLTVTGLFFFFKSRSKYLWLFTLSFLFPFVFLSGTSLLNNHFVFGSTFIALLSALSISEFSKKFRSKRMTRVFLYSVVSIILLLSTIRVYIDDNSFFGKNEMAQLSDYKEQYIDKNSLVIVDSRIYRGRIVFAFHDRHYLESTYFIQLVNNQEALSGPPLNLHTYFIEAVTDDSGWGTIKNQPEFNQSTEQVVAFFKKNSRLVKTINDINGKPHFNVYETALELKSSVQSIVESTHRWFYYPVGYNPVSTNLDYYETYNTFDSLLDKLAHAVLYIELFVVLLLILVLFYLFYTA